MATGRLHRVYRGVYAVGRPGLSLHGRWMAAVLVCGPDALLSHRSAAMLHDLARTDATRIDVTAPGRAGRTHHGLTVHRAGGLTAADRTVVSGIPVSSVSRTLLDLAAVLPLQRLERALGQAERLRVFDLGPIRDALARAPRHRGALRLRAALAELDPAQGLTESELEERFQTLCRDAALPEPERNRWLAVGDGHVRPDFAWTDARLIVETDGAAVHRTAAAFERDRRRDQELTLARWRVIRITWSQIISDPERIVRLLAALLEAPAGRAPADTMPRGPAA